MVPQQEPISSGCQVEVNLLDRAGNKERLTVVIVPDEAADFASGYLSENTPLAKVLLGERAGTIIPYFKGDIHAIEIVSVARSEKRPADDTAKKRRARMKKAIRQVEDTNAVLFASSFSGKWGDYDPDSIPKNEEPE